MRRAPLSTARARYSTKHAIRVGARPIAIWAGLAALWGCADRSTAPNAGLQQRTDATVAPDVAGCDPNNGKLLLPPGFCAMVVAKGVGVARHMVVRPNGDIYVALDGPGGAIAALRDTSGDGRADIIQRFGPTGGNGIAWRSNQLFFATNDAVYRWDFPGTELVPNAGPAIVVSGLTVGGDHPRKTVVLDDADGMYVNIGSGTNSCQVANRVDFSPGISPCPELSVRAGIWMFSARATGQSQFPGARFASELRNMNALAIDPANGALYGAQNGRDQLFDNWPDRYTAQDEALLPAEELFRITQGERYGWPYCYYDGIQQRKVLSPEYGGDGAKQGRCESRRLPLATYPAHWAPLSMLFYTGTQFPAPYRGGLFIAFHGSRFDASLQPAGPGYLVAFVPWANGAPAGAYQTFADGFIGVGRTPATARHRAVGLAAGPDGALHISDDKEGFIWRVTYLGTTSR